MRQLLFVLALVLLGSSPAVAHEGRIADLKTVPPDHQVKTVGYCKGLYHLALQDGSTFEVKEFNLRIKTDSGPNGPNAGTPVLIPAGMRGDRVFLIFSDPEEMKTFVKKTC